MTLTQPPPPTARRPLRVLLAASVLLLPQAPLTAQEQAGATTAAPATAPAPLTAAELVPLESDSLLEGTPQPEGMTAEEDQPPQTQAASRPTGPVDPDLPQPFDPGALGTVVSNSPFTRIVSVSDSLVLTGMAYVDGRPVVTIFDKDSKQSIVVSDEPNLKGWKLVSAQPAEKIDRAQAKIAIGGETFSIRHAALSKEDMQKKDNREARREGGGPPGPPPSGGDDRFRRSRGPSEEDRKKYESLSEGAREKFRSALRDKFSDEKFRNASEEDRRNAIRSIFDKIEKEDKGGR